MTLDAIIGAAGAEMSWMGNRIAVTPPTLVLQSNPPIRHNPAIYKTERRKNQQRKFYKKNAIFILTIQTEFFTFKSSDDDRADTVKWFRQARENHTSGGRSIYGCCITWPVSSGSSLKTYTEW
jgi:hypothetical protein